MEPSFGASTVVASDDVSVATSEMRMDDRFNEQYSFT